MEQQDKYYPQMDLQHYLGQLQQQVVAEQMNN
jgi:hypothetical protein